MRLLLALLLLLPLPALADVTATYSAGKKQLVVEADDGGNSRIEYDGQFGIIRRDGVEYAVVIAPTGEARVTELNPLIALMKTVTARDLAKDKAVPPDNFLLTAKGEAMVGARKGTVWSFGPRQRRDGSQGRQLEIVMSADPELAPIAAIFSRAIAALAQVFESLPEANGFAGKAAELAAKGAPLRFDKLFELQSVGKQEIDSKRFELPAPAVPAAEFMAVLGGGTEFKPLP